MQTTPFKQVDVFTTARFKGNPVAVVLRAEGLTTQQMQRIANWTNLSETTFVLPTTEPQADYRVRIFTPSAELPFAGHPTIGTAHALLESGLIKPKNGVLVQECGAGLVKLKVTQEGDGRQWIAFDLPKPTITPLGGEQVAALESALRARVIRDFRPALVDVGPKWIVAQMASAQDVLACQPDFGVMKQHDIDAGATGITIFGESPAGTPTRIEVRSFAPSHGVNEDPVCGSGNGAVAAFIRHSKQLSSFGGEFYASQGAAVGRCGVLRLMASDRVIRVGGPALTCIEGHISF